MTEPLSLQVKRDGIVGLVPGNYVELVPVSYNDTGHINEAI